MRRRKETLIMVIILIVLFLGVGYAYLTNTLNINGTTDVDANTWNVYWDNVQVIDGSVTGSQVITAPTIDTNKTKVSFHIRLKEPGEYYEFTVDAKNTGTIDAMVGTFVKQVNGGNTIPNYLDYTITYSDGMAIDENHLIASGSTETYRVRIEYKTDVEVNDLPNANQTLSLTFGVNYTQANATQAITRLYYWGGCPTCQTPVKIGYPLPEGIETYNDYMDILGNDMGHAFLILVVKNGIITDGYGGLSLNGKMLNLRIGGATYNESTSQYNNDSIYYEDNVKVLKRVFGESRCFERTYLNGNECYECNERGINRACKNGSISVLANVQGFAYGCGNTSDQRLVCGG